MMVRLGLRPRAQQDIDQTWSYSVESFGHEKAIEYIDAIRQTLELLCRNPGLSRQAEGGRANLRKYPAGSHMIYFHMNETAIDVVRILHSRMDWPRHM
jgi:toxin ParE1/3/4